MNLTKLGGFALISSALSSPAWAGGDNGGCEAIVAVGTGFVDVSLGETYTTKATVQANGTCELSGLYGGIMVTSEADELSRPFKNKAAETDIWIGAEAGPISFEIGQSFYTETGTQDTVFRANLVLPLGLTLSGQRYSGITNSTSVGLASPSLDVFGALVSAGAWYTEFDELHTDPGNPALSYTSRTTFFAQADVPPGDSADFEFQAFRTEDGETGFQAMLVFRLG